MSSFPAPAPASATAPAPAPAPAPAHHSLALYDNYHPNHLPLPLSRPDTSRSQEEYSPCVRYNDKYYPYSKGLPWGWFCNPLLQYQLTPYLCSPPFYSFHGTDALPEPRQHRSAFQEVQRMCLSKGKEAFPEDLTVDSEPSSPENINCATSPSPSHLLPFKKRKVGEISECKSQVPFFKQSDVNGPPNEGMSLPCRPQPQRASYNNLGTPEYRRRSSSSYYTPSYPSDCPGGLGSTFSLDRSIECSIPQQLPFKKWNADRVQHWLKEILKDQTDVNHIFKSLEDRNGSDLETFTKHNWIDIDKKYGEYLYKCAYVELQNIEGTATYSANKPPVEKKRSRRRRDQCVGQLWEFMMKLLLSKETNPSIISWEDEPKRLFRIVNTEEIARRWGKHKGKSNMTYANMSRTMRYYREGNGAFFRDDRKRVYGFGPKADLESVRRKMENKM